MGPLHTRRCKGFVPTSYKRTTRLPNGGSFDFVLVPASQPHRLLLSEAVKQVAPTKRSVHRGDLERIVSHRITAIRKPIRRRDTLAHHKKLVFVQSARGTGEAQKATPVRALALARGCVSKTSIGGSLCTFLCAKAPSSGEFLRDLPAGRSLKAVSFPSFLVRRQESLKKRNNRFHKTSSYAFQTKN